MPQKTRKRTNRCRRCGARFRGQYCPRCGLEVGAGAVRPLGGFFGALVRFVGSLVFLAVLLAAAFLILDNLSCANDPAHTTAYSILQSVRNALPASWLGWYDAAKTPYVDAVKDFFFVLFS